MGQMKQLWSINDIRQSINVVSSGSYKEAEMIESIYGVCVDVANAAKSGHDYRNIKGELESSIGVVILKDRQEVVRWSVLAKSGSDPYLGLEDMRRCLEEKIIGKSEIQDVDQTIHIPEKGITGIVFAAAPYASAVEARGKKVLIDFAPSSEYVFQVIKSVVK